MSFKTMGKTQAIISVFIFLSVIGSYVIINSTLSNYSILNSVVESAFIGGLGDGVNVIIDRFDGKYVICEGEDKSMIKIESSLVPSEAKEGDVLNIKGDSININAEETKKRKNAIDKVVENLWE